VRGESSTSPVGLGLCGLLLGSVALRHEVIPEVPGPEPEA